MNLPKHIFLTGATLIILISGCAHKPTAKPTGLTADDFWREQASRALEVSQVSAKLLLEYQGMKENASGKARVVAQLPHHFRLELRDPLGRIGYVVTLADKDFVAFYPTLHKAYVDETSGRAYLKHLIGTDLSFSELQGLALGLLPKSLSSPVFRSWEWDAELGQYTGSFEAKDKSITVLIDPERAVLRGLRVKSSANGLTKIDFSEFAPCCGAVGKVAKGGRGISLAHAVALTQEQTRSTLDIEWREVEALDKPRPESIFHELLPDKVERIHLN